MTRKSVIMELRRPLSMSREKMSSHWNIQGHVEDVLGKMAVGASKKERSYYTMQGAYD